MTTTEALKSTATELQRTAPDSAAAKDAQRVYQAALNEQAQADRIANYQAEQAAKKVREKELDFARSEPRKTASISVGVFADWATSAGFAANEAEWLRKIGKSINLGYVCHDSADGSKLCGSNEQYPCKILSVGKGSYWSDQPSGKSGWNLIVTVDLAPELQLATELERE